MTDRIARRSGAALLILLVAGCATAVSAFLALGMLASDLALAMLDPRLEQAS